LVLGDEPILEPEFLQKMIKAMEDQPTMLIVSPRYRGKNGHPLLFRKELFGEIFSLAGPQTIHDVFHAHEDKILRVEAPEWTTLDIDTPEDYDHIAELIKNRSTKP